jgi:peptidoglycan/xylan/chitin deacetylase (PgdA/CDA1 family)
VRRLVIMTYHRVLSSADPLIPGQVDANTFASHLGVLRRFFNVLSLPEAMSALWDGRLPARAVTITFDDGYRDNYTVAAPLLQRYGLPATFFLATGYLDGGCMWNDVVIESLRRTRLKRLPLSSVGLGDAELDSVDARRSAMEAVLQAAKYLPPEQRSQMAREISRLCDVEVASDLMMTSGQVAQLAAAGMELGGHTVSHPILTRLTDAEAATEIERGKRDLEVLTGRRIDFFAYPNGRPGTDFDARHMEMVRRAGFAAAFSTQAALANGTSDRFALPRTAPWDRQGMKLAARYLVAHWSGRL